MPRESRTLEIVARARDQASRVFRRMGATFRRVIRNAFLAPLRLLRGALRTLFSLRGALLGLVAGFAVARVVSFFNELRAGLDLLAKTSDRLGVTTESLTAMKFASDIAGVSFKTLTKGVQTLERNIENARRGAILQVDALEALGLTANDFAGDQLDLVDTLGLIADRLNDVPNQTKRAEIAFNLLGRSGIEMGTLLQQGSAGLQRAREEAERLGAVFTREELARVERFNDAMTRLSTIITSLFQRIVVDIAPFLERVLSTLIQEFTIGAEGLRETLSTVSQAIVEFLASAGRIAVDIVNLIEGLILTTRKWALQAETALLAFVRLKESVFGTREEMNRIFRVQVRIQGEVLEIESQERRLKQTQEDRLTILEKILDTARKIPTAIAQTVTVTADRLEPDFQVGGFFAGLGRGGEEALRPFRDELRDIQILGRDVEIQIPAIFTAAQQAAQRLAATGFQAIEDAFASIILGTQSFRDAFKDMARAILQEIARLIPRLLLVRILSGILSPVNTGAESQFAQFGLLAEGGVTRGVQRTLPLRRFADGGIARHPTLAVFGESGEEAFVPLRSGRIPVMLRGGGAGTFIFAPQITAMDSKDVRRVLIEERGTIMSIWRHSAQRLKKVKDTMREQAR